MKPGERAFEEYIANALLERGGYRTVKVGNASGDFDAGRGLDTAELFAFVEETQPEAWKRLIKLHGGETKARGLFADRLAKELDARGTVDVLRHGVVDRGVTIRLAFFKPAHGLTPQLVARYESSRLTATRQLPYEAGSTRTLDLTLFVNGLPVATAKLKNALTGQSVEDAKKQYRKDRDPKNIALSRRAVVHFAVDTEQVAMTTRLDGGGTRFLPFNRGSGGGKGNPPNPEGHRTAYLWERVWEKDAWLDLLGRFVHVERPAKGSKSPGNVIFPRYHQWDAVLGLTAHARRYGPGESYLVQHSAGSGKSNTIAWLAHRLSSLHAALTPAIDRFQALEEAEQENFRDALTRFVRIYSFLSQVVSFTDAGLERDYQFCRALSSFIKRDAGASLDLGSEVELTHLHVEQTFEGSVALGADQGIVNTIYDGTGPARDPEVSPLSRIIEKLDERFDLNLDEADRLHLDSIAQEMVENETVQRQAAANSLENFRVQFPKHFEDAVVDRLGAAQDFSYELLDDQDLSEQVRSVYLPLVYGRAKVARQEHCPIGELLGPPPKEGAHLEYKSTLRTRAQGEAAGELFKLLQTASLKTVAAFLNSREGGTLLIGVADDGSVFGLDSDYATLRKPGKDDRDLFGLHLNQALINSVGMAAAANVGHEILEVDGKDLCRIHVKPSSFPVEAEVIEVDKNGQHVKKKLLYGRFGNGTRPITDPTEQERYKAQVWGP